MSKLSSNIDDHKITDRVCYRVFDRDSLEGSVEKKVTGTVLEKVMQKPTTVGNSQSVDIHLHEKSSIGETLQWGNNITPIHHRLSNKKTQCQE